MHVLTLPAVCLAVLAVAAPISGQTADEIVARNLQAKGGAEKWKAVSSVKMTGKLSAQGRELPMTVYSKRPNLMRQDITTPAGEAVQGFDGVTPWVIPPGAEMAREITGPQGDAAKSGAEFDGPLVDYAAKGHKVELVGKEKLGTGEVYHLKLTRKEGTVEHYYMDVASGLEVKRATEVDAGGIKQTLESEMSDYKAVDGIMIPHTLRQSVNGSPRMEMTIEKIELNAPLDDALFKMPKK